MRFNQEQATDSSSAMIITHNASVSFEIGTSNISAPIQNDHSEPKQDSGQANRLQSDDRNVMSQDKIYRSNCDAVSG